MGGKSNDQNNHALAELLQIFETTMNGMEAPPNTVQVPDKETRLNAAELGWRFTPEEIIPATNFTPATHIFMPVWLDDTTPKSNEETKKRWFKDLPKCMPALRAKNNPQEPQL